MPYPMPKGKNITVELKTFQPRHEMQAAEVYKDFYGISFIVQGDRKLITPNMISILNAGNVGFTTKHMYHRATYLTETPYSRYLIKFTEKAIEHFLERLHIDDINQFLKYPVYHFKFETQEKISKLFSTMLEEYLNNCKHSQIVLENMLSQLLLIVEREYVYNPYTDIVIENANEKIMESIHYIELNYNKNPSIGEVANYIGFSVSHFSRLFKKSIGISYSGYLSLIKLQHSMTLLVHSEYSLERIAILCGFPDASYLCHTFKQKYGISPSNYRKTHKLSI